LLLLKPNIFLTFLANQYEDEMTHEQIPAASQTPNDTITTPIINSPLKYCCSDRPSNISGERDRRKTDGVRLFQVGECAAIDAWTCNIVRLNRRDYEYSI
jgi:hypothetical protein